MSEDDLIICQSDGRPLLRNTISHTREKLVNQCGLEDARLDDARHAQGTLLVKSVISAKVIQEQLGRCSVTFTTNTYTHVSPGM